MNMIQKPTFIENWVSGWLDILSGLLTVLSMGTINYNLSLDWHIYCLRKQIQAAKRSKL